MVVMPYALARSLKPRFDTEIPANTCCPEHKKSDHMKLNGRKNPEVMKHIRRESSVHMEKDGDTLDPRDDDLNKASWGENEKDDDEASDPLDFNKEMSSDL
ncbi:hypothetical protein Dimus_003008 [Dionaea muscipula]